MENFNFEKLEVWRRSKSLVAEIYQITKQFPTSETYALSNQLQRAIVSVPSNIAEGNSRFSAKERLHFIEIAYGSLMESFCQISVALELGYINEDTMNNLRPKFQEIGKMLSGLRKSLLSKV